MSTKFLSAAWIGSYEMFSTLLSLKFRGYQSFLGIFITVLSLEAVQSFVPIIYPFIHSAYPLPSMPFWKDKTIIDSAEGVQQADPLGLSFLPHTPAMQPLEVSQGGGCNTKLGPHSTQG